jgi:ABC-type multidrug transport system fused ATPase/permease subunit
MHRLLILLAGVLLALPAHAESTPDSCARARDPVRCEARQAALKTCAEKRGKEKSACLDANMPPVDCRQAQNPSGCEAAQRAKEICRGKAGKDLKKCLRDQQPRKAGSPGRRLEQTRRATAATHSDGATATADCPRFRACRPSPICRRHPNAARAVFNELAFSVASGEVVALVGESGVGKQLLNSHRGWSPPIGNI